MTENQREQKALARIRQLHAQGKSLRKSVQGTFAVGINASGLISGNYGDAKALTGRQVPPV